LEDSLLLRAIFVGVTDQDGVAVCSGDIVDRFDYGCEKVVPNIGDDHSDRPGLLGAKRTPGTVWSVSMTVDGGQHSLPGMGCDVAGAVERAGDGRDAEIQFLSELSESHFRGGERSQFPGLLEQVEDGADKIGCKALHPT